MVRLTLVAGLVGGWVWMRHAHAHTLGDTTSDEAGVLSPRAACPMPVTSTPLKGSPGTKYFFTFGDSLSHTTFNITRAKPSASNPFGNPAGALSGGTFKWLVPLVLEFNSSLTLSYNFVSIQGTVDRSSKDLRFVDLVKEFGQTVATKPNYAPWTAENALVGVWMGLNDVDNVLMSRTMLESTRASADEYFAQLQILYDYGLRNFVLLGVPPMDKAPLMIKLGAQAIAAYKKAADGFNQALAENLVAFTTKNRDVWMRIVDTAVPFNIAIDDPTRYGAPNATCYGSKTCLWEVDYFPGRAFHRMVAAAVATTVGSGWFRVGEGDYCTG